MVEHDEEEELLVQTNREEQLLHQDGKYFVTIKIYKFSCFNLEYVFAV